jgi:hypothetical protein
LFEYILLKQGSSPPAVIFISTVLTLLKSPGRVIYTALKAIYETYLLKWKGSFPGNRLLIVYVGTVISRTSESAKPMKLASAVARAFQKKKQTMVFGTSGRFYMALYYAQPLLFGVFSLTQRKIRGLLTNSVRGRPNHTS